MLIPFRSKAAAEFFMLQSHAQTLFALISKPLTAQGVFAADTVPQVLAQLRTALDAVQPSDAQSTAHADRNALAGGSDVQESTPVALKQRAWPLLDMLTRAAKQGTDVTWGV